MQKDIKKMKKQIDLQARIINKMKKHDTLVRYIYEDPIIKHMIGALEFNKFKVHRDTFKKFIETEFTIKINDNTKPEELDALNTEDIEALAINLDKFENVTMPIINKKLEELKYLKLIEFESDNNYIIGTDLLNTVLASEYKRVSKTIKDEIQFKMETEDKLYAYRYQVANKEYLENNKDFLEKLDIYNNIYLIDYNSFVIGRRQKETQEGLYNRIKKLLKSNLIDTKAYTIDPKTQLLNIESKIKVGEVEDIVNTTTNNKLKSKATIEIEQNSIQIPIQLHFSQSMNIDINNFENIFETLPNEIKVIRY